MQVMPQLVDYITSARLEVGERTYDLDWASLVVFTCDASCDPVATATAPAGETSTENEADGQPSPYAPVFIHRQFLSVH